ncbi:uncharacterized protein [Palaemon carinicauda]|uniref:uncharacterized protein n=1 Tax=Palaemon carinicauda TaxID=392227 RepID=UPI0035B64E0E
MHRRKLYVCKLCFEYFRQRSEVCFFRCGHTMCINCLVKVTEMKNIPCHPCDRMFMNSNSAPLINNYDIEKKTHRIVHANLIQKCLESPNWRNQVDRYLGGLEACANAQELQCLETNTTVNMVTNVVPDEEMIFMQRLETPSLPDNLNSSEDSIEVIEEPNSHDSLQVSDMTVSEQDMQTSGTNSSCGIMQSPELRGNYGNTDRLESHARYITQTPSSSIYDLKNNLQEQEAYLKAITSQHENRLLKIRSLYIHQENILKESKDKLHDIRTMKKEQPRKHLEEIQNNQEHNEGWRRMQGRQERPDTMQRQQTEWERTREIQTNQIEWKSITEIKDKMEKMKPPNEPPRKIGAVERYHRGLVSASSVHIEYSNTYSMERKYDTLASDTSNSRDRNVPFSHKVRSFIQRMGCWATKLLSVKVISVVSSDGHCKTAKLSSWKGNFYLHYLQDRQADSFHHQVQHNELIDFLEESSTMAFMDLSWGGAFRGRVHIQLSSDNPLARNFRVLCTGERGQSYVHTKFFAVWGWNQWDERIIGGDYEHNDGRGGAAVLEEVNNANEMRYHKRCETGTVVASAKRDSKFSIVTGHGGETDNILIIGKVLDNYDVLRDAAKRLTEKVDVEIVDCGMVLPQEY